MSYTHGNNTVITNPVVVAESVIAVASTSNAIAPDSTSTGVLVRCTINVTASATGNTITYRVRQGNGTTGTLVYTGTAIPFLTGVLTQSHVVEYLDTSNTAGNPASYTVTGAASAGTMAINSATITITSANAV